MSLEERLEKIRQEKLLRSSEVDWKKRKEKWMTSYESMILETKTWLLPLAEKGLLELSEYKKVINEENIGLYELNALRIIIGSIEFIIDPMGTILSGTFGRADIRNQKTNDNKMLLLMGDDIEEAIWKMYISRVPAKLVNYQKQLLEDVIEGWLSE